MLINTTSRVWGFAVSITVVALIFAEFLNTLVFQPKFWSVTMPGTFLIVVTVAFPIAFWVGRQIREKAELTAKLQELLERDYLTKVATREAFFARLKHDPEAVGVSLMIDIDYFKSVNDTYGHLVGDNVLANVAKVLQENIREKDIVCRFGGEEFTVFLHKASKEKALTIVERIRAQTEAMSTNTERGPIQVTVSIGGSLKHKLEDINAAIKRADEALYLAKAEGRNQAMFDWELHTPLLSSPQKH